MGNTLTIFRNHNKKIYCISPDSTAFSLLKCQSITVPLCMIEIEEETTQQEGFTKVNCVDFASELK